MVLLCKRCHVQFKVKNSKPRMEKSKFWKPLCSVREHVDTAGSDQLFSITAGKSGTLCGRPQTCHHRVLPHRLPHVGGEASHKSRAYWGRSASPLKETPFLSFQFSFIQC